MDRAPSPARVIPALDERGLLPAGVHDTAGWAAVEAMFAFNEHRRRLLYNLRHWIDTELQHVAAGLDLVIGGSYLTTKQMPSDIDCTVIIPGDEIAARGAAMQLLCVDGAKGRIYKDYKVEAYATLDIRGANDLRAYFQYVGEKSALLHHCDATDLRGVIRVLSWLPG